MLPLERYQIDRLLEEKAEQLEAIIGPFVQQCKNAGSYDDDDGRGMQIDASDPYGEGPTLYADLFVNKRGHLLVFSYHYEPYTSFEEDDELTEEVLEHWEEVNRRWFQDHNPDQLKLPLTPMQRAIVFPLPHEIAAANKAEEQFWVYRLEILVRYHPETDHWDLLWKGKPDLYSHSLRRLVPRLPACQNGGTIEESVALKLVRDLLEITERQDR